tara:strand:+ start:455 stop:700 length:246 start_codon:yes stop_codon:yes gene_type:complete
MAQVYSDTSRENDKWSLPDAEVFYRELSENTSDTVFWDDDDNEPYGEGFYYWFCLPGCLPDSSPIGPFETEQAAIEALRNE